MSISILQGQMLKPTLERDGINIAIVDTATSTPALYVDVNNNYIGVNTSAATTHLDVRGNAFAYNLDLTSNISIGGNVYATGSVVFGNTLSVAGSVFFGNNLTVTGNTTIISNVNVGNNISAIGNIYSSNNITATGNISSNNLSVTNYANVGTLVAAGISVTGSQTGTNLSLTGTLTASHVVAINDVSAGGNIYAGVNITAVGNVYANNASINGTIIVPNIISSSNSNINIIPNGTGNLNLENVAINNTTLSVLNPGNLLTFSSNIGVIMPVGNIYERPVAPTQGTTRFNTDSNELETYTGTAWVAGNSGNLGYITDQQFNGDGVSTTFPLDQSSTAAAVLVYINGVGQLPGVSYTVVDDEITFNEAPQIADVIDIRFISYVTTIALITNNWGNSYVKVTDTPTIDFSINQVNAATINDQGVFQVRGPSLQLPSYTVAQTASIPSLQAGQVIYVSNGDSGNPTLAVYDGSSWRRVSLGATIST